MPHRRRTFALAALAVALAACERPLPDPIAPRARPLADLALAGDVVAVDLGVLPGDARSEATYVTEGGTVYGYSYATDEEGSARRAFRWTSSSGIQEVASIPAPPAPPLPTIPEPPGGGVIPVAANAKQEATGIFCIPILDRGCEANFPGEEPFSNRERGFRWSAGGGLQDLDLDISSDPADAPDRTMGFAINRWGHVAGVHRGGLEDEWRTMFWTPLDSLTVAGGATSFPIVRDRRVLLNDNDRVVSATYDVISQTPFAFQPGSGVQTLRAPSFPSGSGEAYGIALAQNNGAHVVGRAEYWFNTGKVDEFGDPVLEWRNRAMLWTLPAANRAAFPEVNASPLSFTSTISLARTGGRYFQLYRGTQGASAGPYVELVDWGDGSATRRTRTRIGFLAYAEHVYARTGTYWVRVYVKDAQGRWDVSERRLVITP